MRKRRYQITVEIGLEHGNLKYKLKPCRWYWLAVLRAKLETLLYPRRTASLTEIKKEET